MAAIQYPGRAGRRAPILLVRMVTFCAAVLAATGAPPFSRSVGVYHWGGAATSSMADGVERVAALGGHVVRVVLSPRYYSDYNRGSGCYPGYSLSRILQEPDVRRALDNNQIDVYIVTAYDGVTFRDCGRLRFLNPSFYTPDATEAVIREYSDFTLDLYQAYQHTHKRFILSNWESDNMLYCEQAYAYATQAQFRTYCDTNYEAWYGNKSVADGFEGLKLWFQARQRGIADGRSRAEKLGIGGMRVYSAPEISIVRALRERGFKSVLYDILPAVMFDFVSYSAYEAINCGDPAARIVEDLNLIQEATGSSEIFLGEAGYSRAQWGDQVESRLDTVIAAALNWGAVYVILWNLYDQDERNSFGLYDMAGQPTALAFRMEGKYRDSN